MSDPYATPGDTGSTTIYCAQCGKPMRIRPEHMQTRVACPSCRVTIEPWRIAPSGTSPAAPAGYGSPGYALAGYSPRNRWIAGTLGVLLGGFGVHRFYLGFTGIGVLQIIVTICTVGAGSIWGLIEGILCFVGAMKDVDGLPLRS